MGDTDDLMKEIIAEAEDDLGRDATAAAQRCLDAYPGLRFEDIEDVGVDTFVFVPKPGILPPKNQPAQVCQCGRPAVRRANEQPLTWECANGHLFPDVKPAPSTPAGKIEPPKRNL